MSVITTVPLVFLCNTKHCFFSGYGFIYWTFILSFDFEGYSLRSNTDLPAKRAHVAAFYLIKKNVFTASHSLPFVPTKGLQGMLPATAVNSIRHHLVAIQK